MIINLVLYYKVVYSWHNFGILVIILFFNCIKLIAMNCITWEFNSYTEAKQGRGLHYSVMSSDKLAWRGTIKTVGMNAACITETCHQHIGSGDSQCIFSIRCPSKFGTIKTDEGQNWPYKPGWTHQVKFFDRQWRKARVQYIFPSGFSLSMINA